jgi:hypothetical protein
MTPPPRQTLTRPWKWLITLTVVGLVAALVWSQLPRSPYPTDLTRLGQGRPALVLAYDIESMGGMEVMAMMDTLRPRYADRIDFLVAPLGAPEGRAFGRRHDAVNGTVVLFSSAGAVLHKVDLPRTTGDLERLIEGALSASRPASP